MKLDETELRNALRRKPAPPELADRIMMQIEDGERMRSRFSPRMLAAAALVFLTLGIGTVHEFRSELERRRGEEARQQLLLALSITAEKASLARRLIGSD
jgi:hypothetical protein